MQPVLALAAADESGVFIMSMICWQLGDIPAEHPAGGDVANLRVTKLEDEAVRQGIKEYANWPTIPQLYVNGEFVGGADIMREMYQSGELQQLLGTAK